MKRTKRPTVDHSLGFVQNGRVILFADIDSGKIWLGETAHRDGQHQAITGNRCGACVRKFRTDVLGHDVPTPAPFKFNR